MNLPKTLLPAILMLLAVCGCRSNAVAPADPYRTVTPGSEQDTQVARRHNAVGSRLLELGDLEGAERELKAALTADMLFGPAHNNLGSVYYRQKRFYLAAWEFQYAAKLMPDRAEPLNNLGLVHEVVGRLDEAADSYEKALKLDPEAVAIVGNLARVYIRAGRKHERTRQLLSDIVLKDTRPNWVSWAREQLALMGEPQAPPAPPVNRQ